MDKTTVSYPEIDKLFEKMDSKAFAQAMNNGTMPKKAPPKKTTAKKTNGAKKTK